MKKVRGFNRKIRAVARQQIAAKPFSMARLQHHKYDCAKLGMGIVYGSQDPSQPLPLVFRQLVAEWLLRTFFGWQQQVQPLGKPFYAAIWLTQTGFVHLSQVVVAIEDRISRYENIFGEALPTGPPLPPEYQQLPGADQLTWTTHRQHEWLAAEDFPHGWPARLLRRAQAVENLEDGRNFLVVPRGWVWVGRATAT